MVAAALQIRLTRRIITTEQVAGIGRFADRDQVLIRSTTGLTDSAATKVLSTVGGSEAWCRRASRSRAGQGKSSVLRAAVYGWGSGAEQFPFLPRSVRATELTKGPPLWAWAAWET